MAATSHGFTVVKDSGNYTFGYDENTDHFVAGNIAAAAGIGNVIVTGYETHGDVIVLGQATVTDVQATNSFKLGNETIISGGVLGSSIHASSLTSVGTITTGTWQGSAIIDNYIASATTWNDTFDIVDDSTSQNTPSTIVKRDPVGNFHGGNITLATNLTIGGQIFSTSDRSQKTDIIDCPYGLNEIKNMNPRQYSIISDPRDRHLGFISQEIQSITGLDTLVQVNKDGIQQLNYIEIIPILVNSIKELSMQVQALLPQMPDGIKPDGDDLSIVDNR